MENRVDILHPFFIKNQRYGKKRYKNLASLWKEHFMDPDLRENAAQESSQAWKKT
jgi:hypothetical protein